MASKKVAKKQQSNVVAFNPSMFEQDAGQGMENMSQDDLALPFLKILGGMSRELDNLEEARKGDIYNTVSGAVYKGKEGIEVISAAYQRRFIQWAPLGEGTGAPVQIYAPGDDMPQTERSAEDNKDYLLDGSGHYLEETHQHFVLVLNEDGGFERALVAMKSTQLKKSRKWNSMISSTTLQGENGPFTPPRFSHVYLLKTLSEENSKGSWHGWEMSKVRLLGDKVGDDILYAAAKQFNESVSEGDVNVKHTSEVDAPSIDADDIPF